MLMGLKSPLRPGGRLPLTLVFERAGEIRVAAEVVAGDATDPHAGHHPP
jgi:copper(I)-binding protein